MVEGSSYHSGKTALLFFLLIIGGNGSCILLATYFGFPAWIVILGFLFFFAGPAIFGEKLKTLFGFFVTIIFFEDSLVIEKRKQKLDSPFSSLKIFYCDIKGYFIYESILKNNTLLKIYLNKRISPIRLVLKSLDNKPNQSLGNRINSFFTAANEKYQLNIYQLPNVLATSQGLILISIITMAFLILNVYTYIYVTQAFYFTLVLGVFSVLVAILMRKNEIQKFQNHSG
jgi:hypothetical protein